jgi:hypothetical protein
MFGSFKALNQVMEQITSFLERDDVKQKLKEEGIKGKLEIEGYQIYFLIKKEEDR